MTRGPDRLLPAGATVEGHLEDWALPKSSGFKPDEEAGRAQDFPPSRQATALRLPGLLGLTKLSFHGFEHGLLA